MLRQWCCMACYWMIFRHFRVCFFFVIDASFLYRRHMINLKQQAVIVHCTTQVYRQQYVACQLYRHDFSNDVVSTVKHGIITNYNVCISDIVFQYHSFQPHLYPLPTVFTQKSIQFSAIWQSNVKHITTAIPVSPLQKSQLFPEVHQRFWLVWAVELASQLFLGAVWHFFIRVVPWSTWIPIDQTGKVESRRIHWRLSKKGPFLKGG